MRARLARTPEPRFGRLPRFGRPERFGRPGRLARLGRELPVGRASLGRTGRGLSRPARGPRGTARAAAPSPAPPTGEEVAETTTRYLLYGLLPFWFLPGAADWWMHRRSRIEDSPGVRESLIHALMMTEIGGPIVLTLLCKVNPLLLSVQAAATAAHEATAVWDVRTAYRSERPVVPAEQHIHSFLESLPFSALASMACLHPDQVRSLLHGGRGDPSAWRLVRRPALPRRYVAGIAVSVGACVVLPYGEELLRCVRARMRRSREDAPAGREREDTAEQYGVLGAA